MLLDPIPAKGVGLDWSNLWEAKWSVYGVNVIHPIDIHKSFNTYICLWRTVNQSL